MRTPSQDALQMTIKLFIFVCFNIANLLNSVTYFSTDSQKAFRILHLHICFFLNVCSESAIVMLWLIWKLLVLVDGLQNALPSTSCGEHECEINVLWVLTAALNSLSVNLSAFLALVYAAHRARRSSCSSRACSLCSRSRSSRA